MNYLSFFLETEQLWSIIVTTFSFVLRAQPTTSLPPMDLSILYTTSSALSELTVLSDVTPDENEHNKILKING